MNTVNKKITVSFSIFISSCLMLAIFSCSPKEETAYEKEVKEWHAKRIENLTKPTGWLSLAGLHWLDEGENTFGTETTKNKIVFSDVNAPEIIGKYVKEGDKIIFSSAEDVEVIVDNSVKNETEVKADITGSPTMFEWGSLNWYIIKRGEKYGIRLIDTANPNITNFPGIEMFDVDPAWKIEAQFVEFSEPKKIIIPNILGMMEEEESFSELRFEIDGEKFSLITTGKETPYFIIFADETNGDETYGAGRFLYVDSPDSTGRTFIDFNKSYNPPCAFSKYATCPLPPDENKLRVKITAGEKAFHGVGH